jgi:hypothetical protein
VSRRRKQGKAGEQGNQGFVHGISFFGLNRWPG